MWITDFPRWWKCKKSAIWLLKCSAQNSQLNVCLVLFRNLENLWKCSACKWFDIFSQMITQMSNQPITWLLVPPRLLWVFQKLLIYWDLHHLQGWGFSCSIQTGQNLVQNTWKPWIVIVCIFYILCCKCSSPTLGIQYTLKWTVNTVQMYLLAIFVVHDEPELLLMQLSCHEKKRRNSQCCLGVLAAWMTAHQRNKNELFLLSHQG